MNNRTLFISDSRESIPIAYKMIQEGVKVDYYIHCPDYKHNFDGIMPKIGMDDLIPALKRNDVVIFDITLPLHQPIKYHDIMLLHKFGIHYTAGMKGLFGVIADKLMKDHYVVGASSWCEHIEFDREAGFKLAQKIGFAIPEYQKFRGLKAGIKFLQSEKGQKENWVLKPIGYTTSDTTYPETFHGELLDWMLTSLPNRLVDDKINPEAFEYIIQEFIDGVECSHELTWDGKELINPFLTIEDKKLSAGNCGPATGSQSNVYRLVSHSDNPALKAMQGLTQYLKQSGYLGCIDANVIFAGETPYFLEWTPRMGWSSEYCRCACIPKGQISNYYLNGFKALFPDTYVASQLVSLYPYPNPDKKMLKKDIKGNLINNRLQDLDDFWLQDVYLDDNSKLRCSASDGIIGIVTRCGDTFQEAIESVEKYVGKLEISGNVQHRCHDHLERATARINKLRKVGIEF